MQMQIKDIHDYYEVITKVWAYFRKYYEKYDADKALEDAQAFGEWVKYKGPRLYEFGQQIMRIAWKEVGQLHEMRVKNGEETNKIT